MGLRAQGLAWVLGLSLGLGGLGLGALTLHLRTSLEEIETSVLRGDAQRLQAGLTDVLAQRRRTAQEWSQWTDFRDYVAAPADSKFPESNLTPAAIGASQLAGLAVLSLGGELIRQVSAPGEQRLDWSALLDPATRLGQGLRSAPGLVGECGLASHGGALMILCRLPIVDSEGKSSPAGILVTADWLTASRLQTLKQVLALQFEVDKQVNLPMGGTELAVPGWTAPARLTQGAEVHQVAWTLPDLVGAPVAVLRLNWSRDLRAQTDNVMRGAQAVVLAVALGLALVLFSLIDRRLVSRLKRVQEQLRALRDAENWRGRLPVEGDDELAALAQEGNHLLSRIEVQVQHLAQLSATDALTGLTNRRGFDAAVALAVGRCRRSQQPLTLAMIDVDHFKRFNDSHGHAAGDRALTVLAQGLKSVVRRAGDLPARLGGEEFVLLMEGTELTDARRLAERLQAWLQTQAHGPDAELAQPMTVSVGLATLRTGEEPGNLLERADQALYRAKANGRNRVEREV